MTAGLSRLPQMDGRLFATDSGLETTLIFRDGYDLPVGEAFVLLRTQSGRDYLRSYFLQHGGIAVGAGLGFILEAPTWRANPDWAAHVGVGLEELARLNSEAISLLWDVRTKLETQFTPLVISGCIGPRGDGYDPGNVMDVAVARTYHGFQSRIFAEAGADMVTAMTLTNIPEAVGIALAAQDANIACAISFTVETDGRLPTGDHLGLAIEAVDDATGGSTAYFMVNCAHPDHFMPALQKGGAWVERIKGLRANASRCSHEELDNSPTLDDGDPDEMGRLFGEIRRQFPHITVVGGCCGTDYRHIERIVASVAEETV